MRSYDVIVLGAGAAGLMCAAGAVKRAKSVLILDHAKTVGEKIRISGGGRCNFTNLHTSPANFLSDNPHFCISALRRYTQYDFIDLVNHYGIPYHEKTLGQLFCDNTAQDIISMLLNEAGDAVIQTGTHISSLRREDGASSPFRVATNRGTYEAASLVIATGGPSIPKLGATGYAYQVAQQFGLRIVAPRPALVPLTFDTQTMAALKGLSGVALDARASFGTSHFDEALLFTHRGFSGPVILQISSYWREGESLTINLLPTTDAQDVLFTAKKRHPRREIQTILSDLLPRRLANRISEICACQGRVAEVSDKALIRVADQINRWGVMPSGSEGY